MKVNIVTNRTFIFLFFYICHTYVTIFISFWPFFHFLPSFFGLPGVKKNRPATEKKESQPWAGKKTYINTRKKPSKKKFKNERITNSGLRSYCHSCLHCRLILPAAAPTYAAPPVPFSCPGLPLASSMSAMVSSSTVSTVSTAPVTHSSARISFNSQPSRSRRPRICASATFGVWQRG